jgi:hypothetical protein
MLKLNVSIYGPAAPAYSIGRNKRSSSYSIDNPAPNSYNTVNDINKSWKLATFSKSRRDAEWAKEGPGPGNYNYKDTIGEGPRAVLTARKEQK